jgi:formylglycine-generating enzyme required for sulfatase activity
MKFHAIPGTTVLFSVYETRVSDYEAFTKISKYGLSLKPHFEQTGDHPVVGTNLKDAIAFCAWLTEYERETGKLTKDKSYRLPTPQEWSAAVGMKKARNAEGLSKNEVQDMEDERVFPWGMEWPPPTRVANLADREIPNYSDGFPFTAPVGSFPPNADGLYDMGGNVWEWTWNRELTMNPKGILRGGSWAYFRRECLNSAYNYEVPTDLRAPTIGFRCVLEDKQRTAFMLASINKQRDEEHKKGTALVMKKNAVDEKAVADLLKLTAMGNDNKPIDPATLKPAIPGKPFSNALSLAFLPLPGKTILMGKTEVTQSAVVAWQKSLGKEWNKLPTFESGPHYPAVNISWEEAVAFCEWLTEQDRKFQLIPPTARYRLPTDIEWSAAAGLDDEPGADPAARHLAEKETYPWGKGKDAWPPAPFSVNLNAAKIPGYQESNSYTNPVGKLVPSSTGFDDLGGNVSEWCQDAWPNAPEERVLRGASWLTDTAIAALSSARQHRKKDSFRYDIGFRCVLDFGVN